MKEFAGFQSREASDEQVARVLAATTSKPSSSSAKLNGLQLWDTVQAVVEQDRPALWFEWSGAKDKMANSEHTYAEWVAGLDDEDESQKTSSKQVDLDLNRTWSEHPYFAEEQGKQALRRVLLAWCLYRPDVGYLQ
eukprot:CAMPEP_0175174414 /NCGR_PEP_ID=MMETSP0087-20121206/32624_1 /TAXON_ID=136419 /ORGANISM="Unknown Unknown, Strain D1" /LENGTH=135 /DNA_ID=CAMNT_0016465891 /DNA_START=157 /DNA_END=561 /DNA_ORIENTATION=+